MRSRTRLFRRSIAIVAMLLALGCQEEPDNSLRHPEAVIYAKRRLSSGRFSGYAAAQDTDVMRLYIAVQADLDQAAVNDSLYTPLSVNHVVVFCDEKKGEVVEAYPVLGDHYIMAEGRAYVARRTLAMVRELVECGALREISADDVHETWPYAAADVGVGQWESQDCGGNW